MGIIFVNTYGLFADSITQHIIYYGYEIAIEKRNKRKKKIKAAAFD